MDDGGVQIGESDTWRYVDEAGDIFYATWVASGEGEEDGTWETAWECPPELVEVERAQDAAGAAAEDGGAEAQQQQQPQQQQQQQQQPAVAAASRQDSAEPVSPGGHRRRKSVGEVRQYFMDKEAEAGGGTPPTVGADPASPRLGTVSQRLQQFQQQGQPSQYSAPVSSGRTSSRIQEMQRRMFDKQQQEEQEPQQLQPPPPQRAGYSQPPAPVVETASSTAATDVDSRKQRQNSQFAASVAALSNQLTAEPGAAEYSAAHSTNGERARSDSQFARSRAAFLNKASNSATSSPPQRQQSQPAQWSAPSQSPGRSGSVSQFAASRAALSNRLNAEPQQQQQQQQRPQQPPASVSPPGEASQFAASRAALTAKLNGASSPSAQQQQTPPPRAINPAVAATAGVGVGRNSFQERQASLMRAMSSGSSEDEPPPPQTQSYERSQKSFSSNRERLTAAMAGGGSPAAASSQQPSQATSPPSAGFSESRKALMAAMGGAGGGGSSSGASAAAATTPPPVTTAPPSVAPSHLQQHSAAAAAPAAVSPAVSVAAPAAAVTATPEPPASPPPPVQTEEEKNSPWVAQWDEGSSRIYFYHMETRETSWNRPDGPIRDEQGLLHAAVSKKDNWKSRSDPGTGQTYYYNTETRESRWEVPECLRELEAAAHPPSQPPTAPTPPGHATPDPQQHQLQQQQQQQLQSMQEAQRIAALNDSQNLSPALAAQPDTFLSTIQSRATSVLRGNTEFNGEAIEFVDFSDPSIADLLVDMTTAEAIQTVQHHTLERYSDSYLNQAYRNRTEAIGWQKELITRPLTTFVEGDETEASLQAFKNIVSYMGDRSTSKAPPDHALKLVHNALVGSTHFKDEVYVQVCKQTRNNTKEWSCVRGWQLLLLLLSTFPPSEQLRPFLMNHSGTATTDPRPMVALYAENCLHRVMKMCVLGPRASEPMRVEMQATLRLRPVNIRVFLVDGRFLSAPVDSWTTVHEATAWLLNYLGVSPTNYSLFALHQMVGSEVVTLSEESRMMDLISAWEEKEEEKGKGRTSRRGRAAAAAAAAAEAKQEMRFLLKVRLYLPLSETDPAGVSLAYMQAKSDFMRGHYPCVEHDILTLTGLQLQEEHGNLTKFSRDVGGREAVTRYVEDNLSRFTPASFTAMTPVDDAARRTLAQRIVNVYSKLEGYTFAESRMTYLEYVQAWKVYGAAYFFAMPRQERQASKAQSKFIHGTATQYPQEVVLAINGSGLLVVDPASKSILSDFPYANLLTWGHSSMTFVILVTEESGRQRKLGFRSDKGLEMTNLIKAYVKAISNQQEAQRGAARAQGMA